jgi:hypothetical protein
MIFFVVLQKIVMLRTGKRQFLLHYIKKGQVLNYVIFITIQNYLDCSARTFLHISNGISFVSHKCIISPYAVSGPHASLQNSFCCLQFCCNLNCGCFNLYCNVCVCVCVCGFCNVWVCVCVGVCMCEFAYVWGFVMCGCGYVWVCVCVGFCNV